MTPDEIRVKPVDLTGMFRDAANAKGSSASSPTAEEAVMARHILERLGEKATEVAAKHSAQGSQLDFDASYEQSRHKRNVDRQFADMRSDMMNLKNEQMDQKKRSVRWLLGKAKSRTC